MKISTEKFLKLSGSRNLDLISDVKLNSAKLSRDRMMLMQKSKKLSAENIQLLGRTKSSLKDSQKFSLIHIDCTLYESSKDVFENIFKRKLISIGGMILIKTFHQYLNSDSLGEQKAFLEMAEKYAVTFEDLGDYGSFSKRFLIKNIG